jgi:ribonucleotide monophosphatase NagD (HAD superfamily)
MGGRVVWAGKPYPAIYAAARRAAAEARGAPVADARILCVGDSVVTDLAGAAEEGLDALFVTGGIHREALAPDGRLDPDALARLLDSHRAPVGTMAGLAW